ncbi:uncharacterized protein LOC114579881 [Dendrobium catenatum]|uniref:uncharacterized protein LOC114579881 n=1 Tax=Dendrobium catenatum TaxID=906689 RepID=UPI00109F013F|nr:uncharacterized protein LOC114579881 [Dendrobium catenatum]
MFPCSKDKFMRFLYPHNLARQTSMASITFSRLQRVSFSCPGMETRLKDIGFILPPCILGEAEEDIGGRYFDVLVKKSFFDNIQFQHITYYKMHDLLHELTISAQECFRVFGDEELLFSILETIRHLSVDVSNLKVLKKIEKFKNLCTLYLYYREDDKILMMY